MNYICASYSIKCLIMDTGTQLKDHNQIEYIPFNQAVTLGYAVIFNNNHHL
jgi:hypothetical protein